MQIQAQATRMMLLSRLISSYVNDLITFGFTNDNIPKPNLNAIFNNVPVQTDSIYQKIVVLVILHIYLNAFNDLNISTIDKNQCC